MASPGAPFATIQRIVDGGLQEANEDYEDECLPAGTIPEYLADIFAKCRSRALELHEVYPPSDDTLLMIEHGEQQLSQFLRNSDPVLRGEGHAEPPISTATSQDVNVLEVGSGSGMISAALLRWVLANCLLKEPLGAAVTPGRITFHTTDKNPLAVQCTRECLSFVRDEAGICDTDNRLAFKCVESSFADALVPTLAGKVDLLLFNPPYVVTDDPEEMDGTGISISWAGGARGCEIIDAFLPNVASLLRKQTDASDDSGKAAQLRPAASLLMCGILENDPHGIIEKAKTHGLIGELIEQRERGEEHLWAIRFVRAS